MINLFWNTISAEMRRILAHFSATEIGAHFYLAGGTALSLQLGHRLSVDLDFFSPNQDVPTIRTQLERALAPFQPTLADSAWGNLVYLAGQTRVGFYGYGHPLVLPMVETEGLRLASPEDIALMKLDALLARAMRKDFYDLYFITQTIPFTRLYQLAPQKFPSVRDFETQTAKRLVYFANAEHDADPELLQPVSWQAVKEYFVAQSAQIGRSWLD